MTEEQHPDDDSSAYWNDVKAAKKELSIEKRGGNRQSSASILREAGISFEEKNGGAHLIVTHNGKVVDFWPGTGLWHVRKSPIKRRGVFPLIKFLTK